MLIGTPLAPNTVKSLFERWLHFVLFISTTIYHSSPGFLIFSCRLQQDLLTNLTDSCLSLLKAILLTITRLISLKQYFLNVITFPEILKIDNQALKKYHLAPTLQSHSFLPTLSNKLP